MTLQPQLERQKAILSYWFGALNEGEAPSNDYYKMWFAKRDDIDALIKSSFEVDLNQAVEGKLKHWEDTPRGALAQIILLDQFSRNIYRGTPKALALPVTVLLILIAPAHGVKSPF